MKFNLILLAFGLFAFTVDSDNSTDRIGVPGPLSFNDTDFKLKWTDKPNDKYYIQEYLADNEALETFNQMLTIHLFNTDISVQNAVKQKTKELDKRKKSDPVCNFMVSESPDGKEFIVDFLLGESKNNKMTTVEFNVYKYKQIDLGDKKAIVVYAYTKRAYGDNITDFMHSLGNTRKTHLRQMIGSEIPTIKISE